jgi:hypothetical protein
MMNPLPNGKFLDYVPHPENWERKLERAALLPPREVTAPSQMIRPRMPMGRDYVSSDKSAQIDARRARREAELRTALTVESTEKHRKMQLEARKRLKESRDLLPEERTRLEAISQAELTELVLGEAEVIDNEVRARLADGVVEPAR